MCGIAGMIGNREPAEVQQAVETMVRAMSHRGPDGRGIALRRAGERTVTLGHDRLAILDLSELGAQPMQSADGRSLLSFNGEIYNFQELREDLISAGVSFRSRTDTEVILEGYVRWGVDVFPRLRGMFTCAIWDEQRCKLVLARDALGIKPLYLYNAGETVLFASEVRALLATGLVPRRLDRIGLASYLNFGSVSSPRTIIEGVESLAPGECVEIDVSGPPVFQRSIFRPRTSAARPPASRAEAVEQLRGILTDSVSRHLISDVPVALFLSGGIDSTAIAAILSGRLGRPIRSFNVAFAEREYAEDRFAGGVAKTFGTEHTQVFLSESDMLRMMPDAVRSMDQPTMDGVNTWVVSKAVGDAGIKVALSGLGGDELFCGYSSFKRAKLLNRARRVPRPLRVAVSAAGRTFLDGTVKTAKFWDMLASDADPASAYVISRRLFSPAEVHRLAGVEAPGLPLPESSPDLVNTVSRFELGGYMTNTLLRDTDYMSMAHSLEVRVPFVDAEVLEYVLQLPGSWKLDGERPKPLLLDALGGLVPDDVWRRPKMGFTLPFGKWMNTALRPELDEVLGTPQRHGAGLEPDAVASVWRKFRTTPQAERWSRPWSLFVLAQWCRNNGVAA